MLTFALFFWGYAWCYSAEKEVFRQSQHLVHPKLGAVNTLVLLSGGWAAARGVVAFRQWGHARPWFYLCGSLGCLFLGVKLYEYTHIFSHGIHLSTNLFWFFYIFLTLLHNVHVLFGVGLMFVMGRKTSVLPMNPDALLSIEATAIYWHLVDILWIFLFPLLYFVH